jgi:hypothetical protein
MPSHLIRIINFTNGSALSIIDSFEDMLPQRQVYGTIIAKKKDMIIADAMSYEDSCPNGATRAVKPGGKHVER